MSGDGGDGMVDEDVGVIVSSAGDGFGYPPGELFPIQAEFDSILLG